ncbi:hypothetical protein V5799_006407 [Amblyomma americanum]|uniref:Uncharacterized protein n=1 Tax=Amblyomma americanum TaxID=6943 RepID=A0AAQ4DWH2_AMBAM
MLQQTGYATCAMKPSGFATDYSRTFTALHIIYKTEGRASRNVSFVTERQWTDGRKASRAIVSGPQPGHCHLLLQFSSLEISTTLYGCPLPPFHLFSWCHNLLLH